MSTIPYHEFSPYGLYCTICGADDTHPSHRKPLPQPALDAEGAGGFDAWWARNHPFDWWAKERQGEPLLHGDRLRVWDLCRRAYDAALTREGKRE